ncbi:hypothetical protein AMJ83_05585 [candidate division WOR_3 bacterium SM23_42]|uniref:DUF1844 domain-containing protein n=1 Tax=candidate division WOR_3 bacterium SM23_42 TaxID=1703779 RepID=A0A0S8FU88_UNCW3|nr:MAG: hypothetical protein AMJ83_05585 [candidate division WOR_3 bacterium SM23_42]
MSDNEKKDDEKEPAQEAPKLLDKPIKVKEIVYMTILSLESKAWAYLDLVAHPETQKHQKDTQEARAAIDAIDALYKVIEADLSTDEKKDIQVRLTNLKLNFAKE